MFRGSLWEAPDYVYRGEFKCWCNKALRNWIKVWMYGATRGCGGKGLLWSLVQVALQFFVSACGCVNWSFASCCFDESNSGVCDCLEYRLTTSQRSVWSPFPTWTWRNCEDHLVFTWRVPDTHVSRIACRTHRSNPIRQAGWNSLLPWPGSFWMTDLTFTLESVKHQLFFCEAFFLSHDILWWFHMISGIEDNDTIVILTTSGRRNKSLGQFRDSIQPIRSLAPWELCQTCPIASPVAGFQSMLNEALKGNSPVLPNVGWHRSMQNHAGIGLYPFVKYVLLSYAELQLIFSCCNVFLLWFGFESRCACRHFVDMLDDALLPRNSGTCRDMLQSIQILEMHLKGLSP